MPKKVIGQYQGKNIYAGTDAEVSAQMFPTGTSKQTAGATKSPYVITSESMKPEQQVKIANPYVDSSTYTSAINSVATDLNAQYNEQQTKVDNLYKEAKNQSNAVADLQVLLGNKTADTNTEYKDSGVNDLYSQVSDLNAQATSLKNEASAIPIQLQNEYSGRGATEGGIAPIQSSRLRDNALKALSLGQQYAIASGNYDKAKNLADQKIEAKYAQIDAEIKSKQTNLESLLKFDLSPAEKKLAETTSQKLKAEQDAIQTKKENEKSINDIIMKAVTQQSDTNKIPSQLLAKAQNAKTPQEAAIALGQWAGDYWQNQKLELELKKLRNESSTTFFNSGDLIQGFENTTSVTADQITQAISLNETEGGKNVRAGASGELASEFQYMPSTWNRYSQEYNNAVNGKNSPIPFSRNLEKEVTRWKVQKWLDAGYNAVQIAAIWNGGEGAANNWKSKVGVNSKGVEYNVPAYVNRFAKHLSSVSGIGTNLVSKEAQSYIERIKSGESSYDEVMKIVGNNKDRAKLRDEITLNYQATGGVDNTKIQMFNDRLTAVDNVFNSADKYFGISASKNPLNSNYQTFKADLNALVASLTMDNLGVLKGPLSDGDRIFIQQASTVLSNDLITPARAKEELNKIKTRLQDRLKPFKTQENESSISTENVTGNLRVDSAINSSLPILQSTNNTTIPMASYRQSL